MKWLATDGRLDVPGVAERLGVAQETVRRDLKLLEARGRLQRVHGGAIPVETEPPPLTSPEAESSPDDVAFAKQLWSELPRTGTLLLGSGPLTRALIAVIGDDPPDEPGLTIVSNSLDIVIAGGRISYLTVYNIGGTVSPITRSQEGDWALQELQRLKVDVSLVCPAGISLEHGPGQPTPAAAAVSQAEVRCGKKVILLARAETMGQTAFVQFAGWKEIDTVMLAGRPHISLLKPFLDLGVQIVTAEPGHPTNGTDTPLTAAR